MTNPDETLPVELLGCPFCGGEAQPALLQGGGIEWAQVECVDPNCGAVGPTPATQPEAISAWNRRAAQSPPPVSEGMVEDAARLRAVSSSPHIRLSESNRQALWRAADLIERLSSPSPGCDAETIEACAKVRASIMSEVTDRDMLVGGREFAAGQVTISDILDHAAHSAVQKAKVRASLARKHQWNNGRPGFGFQCVLCGTIQSNLNLNEDCAAAIRNLGKEQG